MLLRKDLLEGIDEKYHNMLKEVNIPDFTKCIAQWGGLGIQCVSDKAIKEYLHTWAKNKYPFYEMLKGIRKDTPIEYQFDRNNGIEGELINLVRDFPGYAPWLDGFKKFKQNKMSSDWDLTYETRSWLRQWFPMISVDGMTLTHFFKRYLKAPEELVTAIGRIFENDTFTGFYTISIDPVDMMLASENPYNWHSCYRLDSGDCSHADGCVAAILDTSSLITYTWDHEGKFNLCENFELKNVRYKRTRMWISISPEFTAIHFNRVYPSDAAYPDVFKKQMRDVVETMVAQHIDADNLWTKDADCDCYRYRYYGYGEFDNDRIWKLKDTPKVQWYTYDEEIVCPCGCGWVMPGSDEGSDGQRYTGDGFNCSSWVEEYWCEYCDDYCSHECCREYCEGCSCWEDNHPVCDLDEETECQNIDWDEVSGGTMHSCDGHCEGCPLWAQHHPDEEVREPEDLETTQELTSSVFDREGVAVQFGNFEAFKIPADAAIEQPFFQYASPLTSMGEFMFPDIEVLTVPASE